MKGIVHFTVGACGAMLWLALGDPESRDVWRDLTIVFLSGVWATIPDWHWLLVDEHGSAVYYAPGVAGFLNDQIHDTHAVDIFWFHRMLDLAETGHPNLEARIAIAVLITVSYFFLTIDRSDLE